MSEANTPTKAAYHREHMLRCGCLWRYTVRTGWFLVQLGSRCPKSTNYSHRVHGWMS